MKDSRYFHLIQNISKKDMKPDHTRYIRIKSDYPEAILVSTEKKFIMYDFNSKEIRLYEQNGNDLFEMICQSNGTNRRDLEKIIKIIRMDIPELLEGIE